jgi:hypothetical protein
MNGVVIPHNGRARWDHVAALAGSQQSPARGWIFRLT